MTCKRTPIYEIHKSTRGLHHWPTTGIGCEGYATLAPVRTGGICSAKDRQHGVHD